ncbi:prepilin-type N-terminal cleavage/methylation domain-containing protein [Synechococcus sp. MU1625]|uniref:prepilin-type N-terminal cleavage/methylation domain-containing protein n=1 Tax=Synechococcus sp. MU1625 TaxID=2508347 RepID=UPI001CF832D9|nr:prepilin-type N-terminal cleavage/methylation domain-containing protein [Synechococcus sp. MU1625]MCB4398441.1 prepilin-type N-terminal cleavage/methylation domain-containing protein [Synechococcus sp. MU1625]
MRNTRAPQGFTLVELMLAALVGCLLCGVAFQLLLAETRQGGSLAESFQLKQMQRRTLELVKGDLERASTWQIAPDPSRSWPCALAGRQPKLAITPSDGSDPVLYSLGPAPSAIWRGSVLMRCGPAFDLQGGVRSGSRYQNRVVLDGVDRFQLYQPSGLPVLQMQLEQRTRFGGRVRSQGVG